MSREVCLPAGSYTHIPRFVSVKLGTRSWSEFLMSCGEGFAGLGVASRTMRQALVDHARARLPGKRGAGSEVLNLDWIEVDTGPAKLEEIFSVDEALHRLRQFDQQQARIIEMHYVAGMTVEETAQALGISSRTVDREWAMARAWDGQMFLAMAYIDGPSLRG